MRFYVTRTSSFGDEYKPCGEATLQVYTRVDRRSVDDPRKIPAWQDNPERAMQQWYGEGTNHRVEHGQIVRDTGLQEAWGVTIDTLEDLWAFAQKYGNLVIRTHWNNGEPTIEIYDGYRE